MYTALVIGAALLIVIGLTAGLALLLDDDEQIEPVRVRHQPIVPQPIYNWETYEHDDAGQTP